VTEIRRRPFFTPAPNKISVESWMIFQNDGYVPLVPALPDWDPAVSISAKVLVEMDVPGVLEDCNLPPDARLRLMTMWRSAGTSLRGVGEVRNLNGTSSETWYQLGLDADGVNLGGKLDLVIQLLLLSPGSEPRPFAPKYPGTVLFENSQTVVLGDDSTQFPIQVLDFEHTSYPSDAGWMLVWDASDLRASVFGALCLYINSSHDRVVRAVSQNLPEDFDLREAIRFDTARMLIYGALSNDEFVENPFSFPDGSVGAAVRNLIGLYFSEIPLAQLRDCSRRRQLFEAKLQGKLRSFRKD